MEAARAYVPRDPSQGVLQPLVREWWPTYVEATEAAGSSVPAFVQKAVDRLLACGDPENGFIRLRCPDCAAERALPFSCKGRGLCPSCGARRMHDTAHHLMERVLPDVPIRQYVLSPPWEMVGLLAARGEALSAVSRIFIEAIYAGIRARAGEALHCGAVVFVQRFTKALGTYPHLHVIALDGGYVELEDGSLEFREDVPPSPADLRALEDRVEAKFSGWLKRHGFLEDEGPQEQELDGWWTQAANEPSGVLAPVGSRRSSPWEVDARVRVAAGDRKGREQLCRYVARPPFAEAQLEVLDEERVRLTFRSPMRSGQGDLVLHPLALMRKLAWLVPPPAQHQVRYAGVLAPAAKLRPLVVPAGRVGVQRVWFGDRKVVPSEPVSYRTSWARLLARVYDVDGHACPCCPGTMRPVGAVLPPQAGEWISAGRIDVLVGTGPPSAQLAFAM